MRSLPPLNALRAFETVARLGSMKDAAEELAVTPGAVSQQVALLEDRIGTALFRRLPRSLELTEAGRTYFSPVRAAFRQIEEATRRVTAISDSRLLTLSAPPAFATTWLVPRLGDFHSSHPEIDLRVVTSRLLADFEADGIDMAIRHGLGRYNGLRAERVAAVRLIPVCSKALLHGGPRPTRAADLAALPLLHDAQRRDWPLWFEAHGVRPIPNAALTGPSLDDQVLLIQAAIAGQGVALVTEVLARPELARRRLLKAIDLAWPQEFAYWLVYPHTTADQPKIVAFRQWVLAQSAGRNPQPPRSNARIRSS
ncbi:MAG: transcriptional regulator GcvA [Alphaproteobacteria bacterium]|nr:transcriptional regulator GcvA [Alphaproteobacteria bacterium]